MAKKKKTQVQLKGAKSIKRLQSQKKQFQKAKKKEGRLAKVQRYNKELAKAKEKYKRENGYSIAYNWKNSDEFKRITRNKNAALNRYDRINPRRQKRILKTFVQSSVIASAESYHKILSYGSGTDKAAMSAFDLMELGGAEFEAQFSFGSTIASLTGFTPFTDKTRYAFSNSMQDLYMAFMQLQLDKVLEYGILGDVIIGTAGNLSVMKLHFFYQAK